MSDPRVIIHFDIESPVELKTLSRSFEGLARQYHKNIRIHGGDFIEDETKLYLTKIESNCILAELAASTAHLIPGLQAMDYANIFLEFVKRTDSFVRHFQGKKELKTLPNKEETEDIIKLLEPVTETGNGALKIEAISFQENGEPETIIKAEYLPKEVAGAHSGALAHLENLMLEENTEHKMVLMWLPQLSVTKSKDSGQTPDRGIIEEISKKEMKVYWLSDLDAKRVKTQDSSPLKKSYIVDVNVLTKKEKPIAYRIVRLHDIIEDDAETSH